MTTREQKLRELLEKWRHLRHQPFSEWDEYGYATYEVTETCADELAAILAEPVEVSEEMVEHVWDQLPTNVDITRHDVRLVLTAALNIKEPGQ